MPHKYLEKMDEECKFVEAGTIFRIFDAKCTRYLFNYKYNGPLAPMGLRNLTNPHKSKLALSAPPKRGLWLSALTGNQVQVCNKSLTDPKPFAKKGYMLRLKCRPPLLCPYDQRLFINIGSVYSEATGPNNTVTSTPDHVEEEWVEGMTEMNFTMHPPSIGDPHGFGSAGMGSCHVRLTITNNDKENTCRQPAIHAEFRLGMLGYEIDYLAGTPVEQHRDKGCVELEQGMGGMYAFWTGVSYAHGPIGLVMVLDCTVWGRSEPRT